MWELKLYFYQRAFFGSIPEGFGNRGESTMTKLPKRNTQWQTHHNKDQTTANRTTVLFFLRRGTAVWPREFTTLFQKQIPVAIPRFLFRKNSRGKIPVAIPRFLLGKNSPVKFPWPYRGSNFVNKKKHRHSIRRGLVFRMVLLPLFIPHW